MAKVKFIKGHTLFAYFAGDVVDVKELGAEVAKKLEADGFVVPATADDTKETPEGKLKPEALEVRSGDEATDKTDRNLPQSEEAPIANVPDRERLGLDEKPVVVPAADKGLTAKNVIK